MILIWDRSRPLISSFMFSLTKEGKPSIIACRQMVALPRHMKIKIPTKHEKEQLTWARDQEDLNVQPDDHGYESN